MTAATAPKSGGTPGLAVLAYEACDGDVWLALTLAVKVTRWKMIARGELEAWPGEELPEVVERELLVSAAPKHGAPG